MQTSSITSTDMLNDLVKSEALNDFQRMQIERIIKVAYNEGRIYEHKLYNSIQRNLDNSDYE